MTIAKAGTRVLHGDGVLQTQQRGTDYSSTEGVSVFGPKQDLEIDKCGKMTPPHDDRGKPRIRKALEESTSPRNQYSAQGCHPCKHRTVSTYTRLQSGIRVREGSAEERRQFVIFSLCRRLKTAPERKCKTDRR